MSYRLKTALVAVATREAGTSHPLRERRDHVLPKALYRASS